MNTPSNTPPQASLLLRIFGGIYLLYLAWDLYRASVQDPVYLIAVVVFGLVGGVLLVHSVVTLVRHKYFRKNPSETESTEDWEDESDE